MCVLAALLLLMCPFFLVKNSQHCQWLMKTRSKWTERKQDSVEELLNGFERKQRASWDGEKLKSGSLLSLEYLPGNTSSESVSPVDKVILS